ncbi:MAG: phytanoyl-CoA dioxygenase family protein, partial [Pseudomonadota bacterium]|nr:phytanoyl-CoA dioxygenase family protein [Pseudomonadota bacterium]
TSAQQAAYHRDGYAAPIDIFDADEVAAIRSALEAAEADHGELMQGPGSNNAHYVLPVLDSIAHDSRILDAVEDLIGPDINVAGTTLFIKEPETKGFISWHQDARYIGLEPHDWVTAWLAISDVTEENGCIRMVPGSHKAQLVEHVDTYGEDNLLTRGQTVPDIDESATVAVPLKPGQLSLHHPRIVHGSGPNMSGSRRIGFAIQSYIATNVDQVIGKIWVQTARGTDSFGYHEQAPRPQEPMRPEDIAFRDLTNEKLSEIFYAGAEQKGRY